MLSSRYKVGFEDSSEMILLISESKYSRTSMAQTSLEP